MRMINYFISSVMTKHVARLSRQPRAAFGAAIVVPFQSSFYQHPFPFIQF